jgi:hypothetical protein
MAILRLAFVCCLGWAAVASNPVLASNYSEGIDGDLSGAVGAPTSWGTLGAGSHSLAVTAGGGDFDLVAFSIPAGASLDSIVLDSYSGPSLSFVGLAGGTTWPTGLGVSIDPSLLLGWTHISSGAIGSSILDDIGLGAGAIGFTPPLSAGDYTFEMQDTGAAVSIAMTFNVVPEPSSLLLAALGLLGVLVAACRRRR